MRWASIFSLCSACVLAALAADTALACIHAESDFQGTVRSDAQRYAVFYADGRELLVIGTSLETSSDTQPDAVSLVTATPSLPDAYETVDPDFFPNLVGWYASLDPIDVTDTSGGQDAGGGGIDILPGVQAGPYEITPIQAAGDQGVTELNAWLRDHGFTELPLQIATFYAEQGWYFLAVKVTPESLGEGLADGQLPPLMLGFDTDELVVPLKMEAGMGEFDAEIYLFLEGPLPTLDTSSSPFDAFVDESEPEARSADIPPPLSDIIAQLELKGSLAAPSGSWQVSRLTSADGFNSISRPLFAWGTDFKIDLDNASYGKPSDGSGSSGGCGVAGREPVGGGAPWLLLALLALGARRRQRA